MTAPHEHGRVLGTSAHATAADATAAIDAAMAAAPAGGSCPSTTAPPSCSRPPTCCPGPWRARMNAATMLGQAKTAYQAEIDAACELADFWRFNVHFARQILAEQPMANAPGIWNRIDHRPLEGFVYAITPFNFTAIAGNLPTAPALMGNVVLWKPSMTQQLAASVTMELLHAAGLPDGVINLLPGDGLAVSEVALADPRLAGIHFTGSTKTFQHLWARGRLQHRPLRQLPAAGRRDRRQGLHPGPPAAPTSTSCGPPSSAARSSTPARSARRRRGCSCRSRSGASCATTWPPRPRR